MKTKHLPQPYRAAQDLVPDELNNAQIEHVALRAAETGRIVIEEMCNEAIRMGLAFRASIADVVRNESDLAEWLLTGTGAAIGYRSRTTGRSP